MQAQEQVLPMDPGSLEPLMEGVCLRVLRLPGAQAERCSSLHLSTLETMMGWTLFLLSTYCGLSDRFFILHYCRRGSPKQQIQVLLIYTGLLSSSCLFLFLQSAKYHWNFFSGKSWRLEHVLGHRSYAPSRAPKTSLTTYSIQ